MQVSAPLPGLPRPGHVARTAQRLRSATSAQLRRALAGASRVAAPIRLTPSLPNFSPPVFRPVRKFHFLKMTCPSPSKARTTPTVTSPFARLLAAFSRSRSRARSRTPSLFSDDPLRRRKSARTAIMFSTPMLDWSGPPAPKSKTDHARPKQRKGSCVPVGCRSFQSRLAGWQAGFASRHVT